MADVDVDGLAAKILAGLGKIRGPRDDDDDDDPNPPRRVPFDRLQREIAARKALEGQLAEMRTQVETLSNGYKAQVAALQADVAEQVKTISQRHVEDLALVESGFNDPIGRKTLREAFDAAPRETRGKSPVEHWQGIVAAHKAHLADPEKVAAPQVAKPLTPYLPAPEAPPQGQRVAPPRQPPPAGPGKPPAFGTLDPSKGIEELMAQLAKGG